MRCAAGAGNLNSISQQVNHIFIFLYPFYLCLSIHVVQFLIKPKHVHCTVVQFLIKPIHAVQFLIKPKYVHVVQFLIKLIHVIQFLIKPKYVVQFLIQ